MITPIKTDDDGNEVSEGIDEPVTVPGEITAYHDDIYVDILEYLADEGHIGGSTFGQSITIKAEAGEAVEVLDVERLVPKDED